ncbi:phosphatases II [Aaosphaeria arxii CBS 175.79]|uniref:Phosphatases II n=1 Tax=Aaosphaeria arxii CBS 175.79 TaxID=1450172 RepID=A0A6A5XMM1_9PLEO|nr:phosphatases II [Aaosphaeria arxii CBS 175.79]KAF2014156.1 phosphatases II [Aaosphaeria arxii CBS 175.79]
MADFPRSLERHHEYTYRLPAPPRIVVPPPTATSDMPSLNVGMHDITEADLDTTFLQEMNLNSIIQKNTLLDWSYEMRRKAQMIIPWLYLGPFTAAKDVNFLASAGITMALAVRTNSSSMNGAMETTRVVCQEVASIEAPNYFALIPNFSKATRMINQHLAKVRLAGLQSTGEEALGRVLVFCESGNEKSAAVVAAYLMETMGDFDFVQAMQICQAQRFCVNFDDTIKTVLRSHWDILSAKRAVARSSADSGSGPGTPDAARLQVLGGRAKRTIQDYTLDEDIEMGNDVDPTDVLRFGGRDNTPFRDAPFRDA